MNAGIYVLIIGIIFVYTSIAIKLESRIKKLEVKLEDRNRE